MEVGEYKYFYPDIEIMNTHELCETIVPFNINRKGFSNLTGVFSHKSSRGNLYVTVLYEYDSNAILAEPIKIGRKQPSAMRSSRSTTY